MGPHSKVIGPAIVDAWLTSSSELSAAMALVQTGVVFIAVIFLLRVTRRYSGEPA
jgi:iron(III) transport system permease protein